MTRHTRYELLVRVAGSEKSEKYRFVSVGAWNTLVGYLLFLATNATLGRYVPAVVVLVASYCVSLPHAFIMQRYCVFRTRAPWRTQFARFATANSFIFFANLVFLPVAIATTGANPVVAQGCFVVLSVVSSYFVHKYFSFAGDS